MPRSPITAAITFLALLFLLAPIVVLVLFSFHSTGGLSLPFEGFSLRWYREVVGSFEFQAASKYSLKVAAVTSLVVLVMGTATAFALARSTSRLRGPLGLLYFLPLTLPGLFIGIALLSFFARIGLRGSFYTVLVSHFIYSFPYYVLMSREAFARLDPALEESAADLGAGPWTRFRRVVVPQVWPILAAATALTFALSFDEFPITFFTIGSDSTLPLFIFSRLRRTVDPSINVISTLLMALTIALFAVAFFAIVRSQRRRAREQTLEAPKA